MDFLKMVENLTLLEGAYAYTFLSDTRQPEIKVFSLLICLDATKCVLPSAFTLQSSHRDDLPEIWASKLPQNVKSLLPVGVHRSKISLRKLPTIISEKVKQNSNCFKKCGKIKIPTRALCLEVTGSKSLL